MAIPAVDAGVRAHIGMPRRDFLRLVALAAAAVGLPSSAVAKIVSAAAKGKKPSVIWLHFQECTGCSESLLRTTHPELADLILNLVSLDYHETLFAAAGKQAEQARKSAMAANAGKYVLVVEGAIPTKDGGVYCKVGGQTAEAMLRECAAQAGAIIAIGSCSSWGGLSSTPPNPTGAVGVAEVVQSKPVVTIPGCPPNPYNFLGTVLQYATFGTLPELDQLGRPKFAYGRTIHEDCPRRAHFDAGRFAHQFGDSGHRAGHCLYLLGCKGPYTHASCAVANFSELPGIWPVGIGHPCIGCTEQKIGFKVAAYTPMEPPPSPRPVLASEVEKPRAPGGGINTAVASVAGLAAGAGLTLGVMTVRNGRAKAPPPDGAPPEHDDSSAS